MGSSDTWVQSWRADTGIGGRAAEIVVDAMARYTLDLKSRGVPPRRMTGVYSDLNAAGWLVMNYDAPSGKAEAKVLECFCFPPWELELKRKFTDSPKAIARYRKNLKGFAEFLYESGLLGDDARPKRYRSRRG